MAVAVRLAERTVAWTLACQWQAEPEKGRPLVVQTLQRWQGDADLAGVDGAEALARLPEVERDGWRRLWAEVARLLARVQAGQEKGKKPDANGASAAARRTGT
jgi:hypothetical protein